MTTFQFIPCHTSQEAQAIWQILLDSRIYADLLTTVIRVRDLTRVERETIRQVLQPKGLQIRKHYLPINKQDQQEHIGRIRLIIEDIGQIHREVRQPGYDQVQSMIRHLPIRLRRPLELELERSMAAPEPPPWYRPEDWKDEQ